MGGAQPCKKLGEAWLKAFMGSATQRKGGEGDREGILQPLTQIMAQGIQTGAGGRIGIDWQGQRGNINGSSTTRPRKREGVSYCPDESKGQSGVATLPPFLF